MLKNLSKTGFTLQNTLGPSPQQPCKTVHKCGLSDGFAQHVGLSRAKYEDLRGTGLRIVEKKTILPSSHKIWELLWRGHNA